MQPVIRKTVQLVTVGATLIALSATLGCAFGEVYWTDPLKREYALNEAQKRYTNLVRFGAFARASKFVDPEFTDNFLENFPAQRDLVFTDFEAGRIQFDDNGKRKGAVVKVTYSAYYSSSPVLFEIVETQQWYREGSGNTWLVRPQFEGLEKLAAAN